MKIPKAEFKSIIKECLKELINEGAIDHMVGGMADERAMAVQHNNMLQDPRVRAAASQTAGGNPQQTALMEQIFADTALNSLPHHMRNEVPGQGSGINLAAIDESFSSSKQHLPQRNPLPPRHAQQQSQQRQAGSPASRWANLAFNSPISNRPSGGGSAGHLPGSKKGSFE